MSKKIKKEITGEEIIKAIDDYKKQLYDNPKISATKFSAMQTALYGCKQIVRHLHNIPSKSEYAWVK